jgi:hypothetical protein
METRRRHDTAARCGPADAVRRDSDAWPGGWCVVSSGLPCCPPINYPYTVHLAVVDSLFLLGEI